MGAIRGTIWVQYMILLPLMLSLLAGPVLAKDEKLELVLTVFRHGDRTPIEAYPNDPHQEDAWPQGWGQLTLEGMRQEYHLGSLFKERYIDSGYMSSNYSLSQLYVRSTDYDRTLMSAECVLAGLYPPNANQEFRPGLQWQPIPVHTVPQNDDNLLRGYSDSCYRYKQLRDADPLSLSYITVTRDNQNLFDKLSQYTGEIVNVTNIWTLYDTLFVEDANNLSLPVWYDTNMEAKLQELSNYKLGLYYDSDQKKQLSGGVWANQVLGDMEKKVNGTLDDMKLVLYSAHDTTVAAMLSVFGLFNGKQPLYSSAFIVELYSHNSNYYVKFYYRNDTWSDDFIQLVHSQCTTSIDQSCSLSELQQLMEQYRLTPTEWSRSCDIGATPTSSPSSLQDKTVIGLIVGVAILGIILIATVIVMVLFIVFCQRKTVLYKPLPDDMTENL